MVSCDSSCDSRCDRTVDSGVGMCHLIILATLLSLASGQTSDCYDQNVRYNGDSLTVTNAK